MKRIISFIIFLIITSSIFAQNADTNHIDIEIADYEIQYNFKWKRDVPLIVGSSALYFVGKSIQNSVEPLTIDEINSLRPRQVNIIDRPTIFNTNKISAVTSDYGLYASIAAPFTLLAFKPVRREFFPVLVVIGETALTVTGITNITKGAIKRNRPYVYNKNISALTKQKKNERHSFFSGHTSHSAAYCFLTAHLINRYSKKDWVKKVAWGSAIVIPATVAYMRVSAGRHFPTDVMTGYVVGAGIGLLIPQLHRNQLPEKKKLSLNASYNGFILAYRF